MSLIYNEDGIQIYHGDCREIMPTLPPVDLIFTDPPYGHNNNNNGDLINRREAALGRLPSGSDKSQELDKRPIANDSPEETAELVSWFFSQCPNLLKPGCCCCCCCCGGGGPDPQFARWVTWMNDWLTFKQMVVWDKGKMGMGWHYRRSYEVVLVGHKGQRCNWYDDTDSVENIIRPGDYGVSKLIPSATDHPTPKPWQLAAHFIKLHTKEGDTVLDPFMGGGSTAYACKMMNRKFIGIEIERQWIDLTIERLRQGTLGI